MIGRHPGESAKPGVSRATRYTPAFTIAAACRYALTGVGAAMAPGSQKWNGTIADFDSAPTSTRISATAAAVPLGGEATSSDSRYVPDTSPRMTTPTSIARPPAVVTSNAWVAARRLVARSA